MTFSQPILFVFLFKTIYDDLSTEAFGEFYNVD